MRIGGDDHFGKLVHQCEFRGGEEPGHRGLLTLCRQGRRQYQDRPPRYEYRLTEKGLDLYPVLVAIMRWGDRWKSDDKPPVCLVHKLCDHDADPRFVCGHCGEDLAAREVRAEPGPGLSSVAA